jgi:hypothetical protein
VYRERGLAEPAGAGHHRDADRAGMTARTRAREQVAQAFHLFVAAGEVGDVRGKLRGDRRGRPAGRRLLSGRRSGLLRVLDRGTARLGGLGRLVGLGRAGRAGPWLSGARRHGAGRDHAGRHGAVLGQQLGVQLAQLRARVDAELLGDHAAGPAVDLERLGVPARAVQRPHQQQPQPLPQRVVGDQPAQLRDRVQVSTAGELRLDAQLGRVEVDLGEPLGLRLDQRRRRDVGQRRAVPQGQRLAELGGGDLRIVGGERPLALADQRLEQQHVGICRADAELIAGAA